MTSADRAATAAKLAAARAAGDGPRTAPTARTAPITSTWKATPARHHALREREIELMRRLNAVRGIRQQLLDAMVAVYLTDETVARRVDAQLEKDLRT